MTSTIRPYVRILSLSWQKFLAYRLNFALHGAIVLTMSLAYLWLWQRLLVDQPRFGDYGSRELITYLVGALTLNGVVSFGAAGDVVNVAISRGELNQYLTKPLSALGVWLATDLARHALRLLFVTIALLIVVALFRRELLPPVDPTHLLAATAMVALAYGIVYHALLPMGLAAFWLTESWSLRFGFRIVGEFATGAFIPLTLFPSWLQTIVFLLPFKFLSFIPMQLYLGRLSPDATVRAFVEASVWLVGLVGLTRLVWRAGLKRYDGVGV